MLHERYYVELEKYNKLVERKNVKSEDYNGIYDRYQYPVLTREHIPLHWRYDLNPETDPYFMAVSYIHLTLPTKRIVVILVVAGRLITITWR